MYIYTSQLIYLYIYILIQVETALPENSVMASHCSSSVSGRTQNRANGKEMYTSKREYVPGNLLLIYFFDNTLIEYLLAYWHIAIFNIMISSIYRPPIIQ